MNWLGKMLKGLGELSPSCREVARLQSEAMDRPLQLRQRIGLRIHLVLCKWCRRYGRHLGFLRSAARQLESQDEGLPTQLLRTETKERIRKALGTQKE